MVLQPGTMGDGGYLGNDDIVADCLSVVQQLEWDFEKRNALYESIDKVLFLEEAVSIPDNFKKTAIEVRSPLPLHIANSITAALSINAPYVRFQPIGDGPAAENNQLVREKFFEASWERQEQDAERRLFRLFMYSLVTKGEAIMKTTERTARAWAGYTKFSRELSAKLDDEVKSGRMDYSARDMLYDKQTEQYKRLAPYPIVSTDVPPESFMYIKGEDGFTTIVEKKQVPYYDTLEKYGAALDTKGRVCTAAMGLPRKDWTSAMSRMRTLTMLEVWTCDKVQYILRGPGDVNANGQGSGWVVKQYRHGYGDYERHVLRGPYFHALGITTSSRDIEKQGLSVLFAYLHLFPLLNSLLTIQSQAAFTFGFPAYKRTTPQAMQLPGIGDNPFGQSALDQEAGHEIVTPGSIYPHDISPIDQPRTGVDLDKAISLTRSLIQMALPDVATGIVSGEQTGVAINQAAHLASLAWDPIVDNAQFCFSKRVGFESWLIENKVQERVTVWGEVPIGKGYNKRRFKPGMISIAPEDLGGVHRYKVMLKPKTPSNLTIEVRTHGDLLKMRLESYEQAIEALGNNPIEVKRAWMRYEIENDPAVKAQIKQRLFQDLGTMDQQALSGFRDAVPGAGLAGINPAQQQTGAGMPLPGAPPPIPLPGGPPAAAPPGAPSAMPQARFGPGVPGLAPGQPAGIRNPPAGAQPIPGMG